LPPQNQAQYCNLLLFIPAFPDFLDFLIGAKVVSSLKIPLSVIIPHFYQPIGFLISGYYLKIYLADCLAVCLADCLAVILFTCA
jgi:hypothetical protein